MLILKKKIGNWSSGLCSVLYYLEWFLHAHKLSACRDMAISNYRRNDLYLFLIMVFAQLSTSLIDTACSVDFVHDWQYKWIFQTWSWLLLMFIYICLNRLTSLIHRIKVFCFLHSKGRLFLPKGRIQCKLSKLSSAFLASSCCSSPVQVLQKAAQD